MVIGIILGFILAGLLTFGVYKLSKSKNKVQEEAPEKVVSTNLDELANDSSNASSKEVIELHKNWLSKKKEKNAHDRGETTLSDLIYENVGKVMRWENDNPRNMKELIEVGLEKVKQSSLPNSECEVNKVFAFGLLSLIVLTCAMSYKYNHDIDIYCQQQGIERSQFNLEKIKSNAQSH